MANISMRDVMLACHPATPPFLADYIEVEIEARESGRLWLRYFLECDTHTLMLPVVNEPARADGLWQTTCFELFIGRPDTGAYLEYNFSPSTEWAVYRFSGYREGKAEQMVYRPQIACDFSDTHFALEAEFELPDGWRNEPLLLGLSAVVEESDGTKSYWALAHPPGKPDFHHRDCFALHLEAPSAA